MMYVSNISPYQQASLAFNQSGLQSGAANFQGFNPYQQIAGGAQGFPIANAGWGFNPALQTGAFGMPGRNTFAYSFVPNFGQQSGNLAWPQINNMAQNTLGAGGGLMSGGTNVIQSSVGMVQPRVELAETNSDVVVTAELPNININDLYLTVTDDSLSISCSAFDGNAVTSLHRTIALPTTIKSEYVEASYSNGVLETRLPKADVATRRKIRVNIG